MVASKSELNELKSLLMDERHGTTGAGNLKRIEHIGNKLSDSQVKNLPLWMKRQLGGDYNEYDL